MSSNKPVVLNYRTGISGGVNAAGQRISYGHATVVSRVRIFDNGRFIINVMNPGSGATRFTNYRLFHLIFGVLLADAIYYFYSIWIKLDL